jgi:hypothetical protein
MHRSRLSVAALLFASTALASPRVAPPRIAPPRIAPLQVASPQVAPEKGAPGKGAAPQGEAIPAPLADELPALAEQSSWIQRATYEGERPDQRVRGAYPVGNGRVFGCLGLGARANTMQALTGPHYQTDAAFAPKGHFGEVTIDLVRAGALVALPEQRVSRVRGAAFVVSEDAAPGGPALRTLTFAPPDGTHVTRVIEVVNGGAAPLADLALRVLPEGPVRAQGDTLRATYASARRPAVACFALTDGQPRDGALHAALPELAPGAAWRGVLTITTGQGSELPPGAVAPPELAAATAAARTTLAWWSAKLAGTAYFDTDHRKLNDLVADWKSLMLVQRCAQSGVVAPMVYHRAASVRDSLGPMLFFLRFHMWPEARAILEYFFRATRLLQRVPSEVPLDLDFRALAGTTTDWNTVEVPAGETPSWIILLHFWYWRATHDGQLLRDHWPLLDACLKKQKRGPDSLLAFGGDEAWLHGAVHGLFPERVQDRSYFVADDPSHDRRGSSFASGVLFLMSMHAFANMIDGLDAEANPGRWAAGKPEQPPGERYLQRAFGIMADIEKRYWLEDETRFAPALSPVTLEPHRAPFADANLLPLWVGWTFPSGEKSSDNLRSSLAHLWRRGTRIGSTPTVGYANGAAQGMLLTALSERDGKRRLDCLDELLRMAEPAGEWGELHDPDGRPTWTRDPAWPNRAQPGESGIDLDAILFAISGIRFAAVPNWDDTDIRIEVRMPHGASHVTFKNVRKDGREINVFVTEEHRRLSAEELEQNDRLPAEKRRDPEVEHRRMRVRVEQLSADPPRGYWDVALNAMNTVFVRYLKSDLSIDESEFWHEDELEFLPADDTVLPVRHAPRPVAGNAQLLVLTARASGAEIFGMERATIADTGMPCEPADLAALLLDGEKPRHPTVFLDWGWDRVGPSTFKTAAFWNDPAWTQALAAYRAAGGVIRAPEYLERYELERVGAITAVMAPGGRLEVAPADPAPVIRTAFTADAAGEVVLRIGSGCGLEIRLNGAVVFTRSGARAPLPDADAQLLSVAAGRNELEIRLVPDGDAVLYLRLSDARGLPAAGIRPEST